MFQPHKADENALRFSDLAMQALSDARKAYSDMEFERAQGALLSLELLLTPFLHIEDKEGKTTYNYYTDILPMINKQAIDRFIIAHPNEEIWHTKAMEANSPSPDKYRKNCIDQVRCELQFAYFVELLKFQGLLLMQGDVVDSIDASHLSDASETEPES